MEEELPQKEKMKGLVEGHLCHYIAYNERHLAAIIIGHNGEDKADLVVFTNMLNFNGIKNFGQQFHQDIPYSEDCSPGTWHFITCE